MEESFETKEIKEQLEETTERAEKAGEKAASSKWTLYLALSTAVIAVFAAIASLEAGALSNDALLYKNEAVLAQTQASDQWSTYQAKGIKGIIMVTQSESIGKRNVKLSNIYQQEAKRYKDEQEEISKIAKEMEGKVKEDNDKSILCLEAHHQFAFSVTLFQIAIALSAIAALIRKRMMWWMALAVSVLGVVYFAKGFLAFGHPI